MVEKTTKSEIMSLFRTNYLAAFHIREMAKLIKKNHVTLLPHLKVLEKDKILTSKTIGKNKVFSLNLENINTKNHIIHTENVFSHQFLEETFLIKKLTKELFNLNITGIVVLFGSYAKKTFDDKSDIDIFFIGEISDKEVQNIKNFGKTYSKIINIKKLTIKNFNSSIRKKDPLINEIVKNHIILQNSEQFVNLLWRYYYEKKQ